MSQILGELVRAEDALGRPTLNLLRGKWAAFQIAAFRCSFSRERKSVAADLLHAQVDAYITELRRQGAEVPPSTNGRAICNKWVNDEWLYRDNVDGTLVYSLTSPALEGLEFVQNLSRERVGVSESRLQMIIDEVRRWALEASVDTQTRIHRLNARIHELERERDRIEAGGEVTAATDDRMLDGYTNLIDLISQLPSDFKRVEESMQEMHRKIIADFRNDDRPPVGAILDEYLDRYDELIKDTREGRAFDGAFVLLRNDDLLLELQENLRAILAHPAASVLEAEDLSEIRGAEPALRRGTIDVMAQRRRLTATLTEHIVNHDALQERELDRVLRGVERELATWMETTGPRTTVPVELLPPALSIGTLRQRFWDPSAAALPPPLTPTDDEHDEPPTIEQLRLHGGPALDDLKAALVERFSHGHAGTVGALFNDLPPLLRRPVEILGLLQLASRVEALDPAARRELYEAIRPGGDYRSFLVPAISPTPPQARELVDDASGRDDDD
ncbi:DUF3375 family protein [Kribbella sp. NPDC004536]|uniref:DUF3375 family protein n=1 Tax=Kribbella sp. NPDC004536 TaxID=3364106 RepID=UPI00367FA7DB